MPVDLSRSSMSTPPSGLTWRRDAALATPEKTPQNWNVLQQGERSPRGRKTLWTRVPYAFVIQTPANSTSTIAFISRTLSGFKILLGIRQAGNIVSGGGKVRRPLSKIFPSPKRCPAGGRVLFQKTRSLYFKLSFGL